MRIGIKSGCFTILTAGHIKAFEYAKRHCDYLIVINNDDDYVYNKKGKVPIPAAQRKIILEAIRDIDEVYIYKGLNEEIWLQKFKHRDMKDRFPEDSELILFHAQYMNGANYIPGKAIADEVIFIPDFPCVSVSDIFNEIKK